MENYRDQGLLSLRQSRDESSEGTDCVTSSGKYPLKFWLNARIFETPDENKVKF